MASIEKRGKSSWRFIVEGPPGPDGTRNQEKMTLKVTDPEILRSKRLLEQHLNSELAKFQVLVESGQYIKPERMTFAKFIIDHWKPKHAAGLGKYTQKNYMACINKQLVPEFGQMELGKIKTIHIANYFAKLRTPEGRKDKKSKPLATNTLLNRHTILKSIFDLAESLKFISSNPMSGIKRPTASKSERLAMRRRKKAYSADEARIATAFLLGLPEHWRLYFFGVMLGGFRRGEMLAVEWPAVDFLRNGIQVEKQITYDEDGKKIEGDVKAIESEAFVPLPKFYMNWLLEYKERWEAQRDKLGIRWHGKQTLEDSAEIEKHYLFHNGFGGMMHPHSPTRAWSRYTKREDFSLPYIRLHDLRHTTAKLLREAGADTKSIQEILRHAREETTSRMYMEESAETNRRFMDQLEAYNPLQEIGNELGTNGEQNAVFH